MKSWKVKTLIGGSVILVLVAAIYYNLSPVFLKFIILIFAEVTLI